MTEKTAESAMRRAREIHHDVLEVTLLGAWRDGDAAGYEPADRPVLTDALLRALVADGYAEVKIGLWRPWRGQWPGARRLANETVRIPISELLPCLAALSPLDEGFPLIADAPPDGVDL